MSIFTKVKAPKVRSSKFNLSFEHKLSCNMGDLVPILCEEVLPHDRFRINTELLIKMAPLKAPVMHRLTAYVHYFFVPTFQINSLFADFINPKVNVDNSIVLPFAKSSFVKDYTLSSHPGSMIGTLADYLGLPVTQSAWMDIVSAADYQEPISIDPFRAYQHIYNSYFRDQNLEVLEGANPTTSSLFLVENYLKCSGILSTTSNPLLGFPSAQWTNLFRLRKRAWAKDYFTSALPSPQAGDDVLLPMSVDIQQDGPMKFYTLDDQGDEAPLMSGGAEWTGSQSDVEKPLTDSGGYPAYYEDGLKGINGSATINDLRRAMALQRFKELAERGGTRYSEMVRNFFGAYLPDWYVDRPILLGGQKQPIKIGEVVQTSSNTESWAIGSRGGIAQSYGRTRDITLKAPCHGYLMGILSIRPEATYQQGLERMWTRKSLYDFAFPQFANLGEQEILQKEIFVGDTSEANNAVFGYTPRYAEYKTGHCRISGEFRNSLAYWHFGRIFDNAPALNKEFVMMNSVPTRPFNVLDQTTEHVYVDLYNNITARRPLPYFGTPSIL